MIAPLACSLLGQEEPVDIKSGTRAASLYRTTAPAEPYYCNYGLDRRKHRTIIGDGAYIGSDSMLVAPVKIGRGAITGAGAVVTKDIPPRSVAVGVPARVIRVLDGRR